MKKGKVFMLPMTLGDSSIDSVIPKEIQDSILNLKYLVVENIKTTRRYLKKISRDVNIDEITFFELNKHTSSTDYASFLFPCKQGYDIGIISEAGCPGIADPGSQVVSIAHEKEIQVIPLVGPSSILMALISSGFNGQKFAFNGYLDRDKNRRQKDLQRLEKLSHSNFTQLFMETPFRNMAMLDDIIYSTNQNTLLSIAADISLDTEFISTKPIKEWKKKKPDLHKRPCIFGFGKF